MSITPDGFELNVVFGADEFNGENSLEPAMRMVRSGLLYADKVNIVSPVASMLAGFRELGQSSPDQELSFISSLGPDVFAQIGDGDPDEARAGLGLLQRYLELPRQERRANFSRADRERIETALSQGGFGARNGGFGIRRVAAETWHGVGGEELALAMDRGVVAVEQMSGYSADDFDAHLAAFVERVRLLMEDPSANVLLDGEMSKIVGHMIDEGMLDRPTIASVKGKAVRAGATFIRSLPAFPEATIASVLTTRQELEQPLRRYRTGMKHLASKLVSTEMDPGLSTEIGDLWHDEILPAVQALESDLRLSTVAREFAVNTATDLDFVRGGTSAVIAFGASSMMAWDELGQGLSTLGGVAASQLGASLKKARQTRAEARESELFFLLKANQSLSRSSARAR